MSDRADDGTGRRRPEKGHEVNASTAASRADNEERERCLDEREADNDQRERLLNERERQISERERRADERDIETDQADWWSIPTDFL